MNLHDDDFGYADAGKFLGLGVGAWVLLVGAILATGAIIWGVNVATSGIRGAGDVRTQRDRADNRVSAQAFFEQAIADTRKYDTQITDAQAELAAYAAEHKPAADDLVAVQLYQQEIAARRTTLTGLTQQCQTTVANYNAEARKTLRADWRSPDLPYEIGDTPDTDCEGTP
jgi:hypothetical protein